MVPLQLPVGEVLSGRWQVERVVGAGLNGTVHLVRDLVEPRFAALKFLVAASRSQTALVARLERDCRALMRLEHPSLARIHDFGWRDPTPFVVGQWVEVPSLRAWLQARGRALPQDLTEIARKLCSALAFLHHHALVHRSVQPGNLCLDEEGGLTLLDACTGIDFVKPPGGLEVSNALAYLSPEQLAGQPVDHRADLYSAAAVLFELATGRRAFDLRRLTDFVNTQAPLVPPSAAALFPDIAPGVSAALAKALAQNPADRFASAEEFLEALEADARPQATPAAPPPDVADSSNQLGRYKLLRKLATGGMAEVFLASAGGAGGFEKQVAVKRILPHLADDPKFVERFLKEARWVARLNHPNIVQIFDCGQASGTYYIAMEFVDGPNLRTLSNALFKRGIPQVSLCAALVADAAAGLAYAHEFKDPITGEPAGLIHRDISPENILVSRSGVVKVVDFGIAKAIDSRTHSTTLRGKYAYLAPEQVQTQRAEPRTDVYALGVVLYELLTGCRPYEASTDQGMLLAIANEPPIPIRNRRPDIPEDLEAIIARTLAKDPRERPTSCAAFSAELLAFVAQSGGRMGPAEMAKLVAGYDEIPNTAAFIPPAAPPGSVKEAVGAPLSALPVAGEPTAALRRGPGSSSPVRRPSQPEIAAAAPPGRRTSRPDLAALAPAAVAPARRPSKPEVAAVGSPVRRRSRPDLAALAPGAPSAPENVSTRPIPASERAAAATVLPASDRWRQWVLLGAASVAVAVLLGAVFKNAASQDAEAPLPPPIHRYGAARAVPSGGGGATGGGGGSAATGGSVAGGGGGSAEGAKMKGRALDRKGAPGHVQFDGPAQAQVLVEGNPVGGGRSNISLKPGTYSAVFVIGGRQVQRSFEVPPGGRVVVRP